MWIVILILEKVYFQYPIQNKQMVITFLSLCEFYRRAQWSLFRVENENVNNFEKYRNILEIPKMIEEENDSRMFWLLA